MPNIDGAQSVPPTDPAPTIEELRRPGREAAARMRSLRMTKQELEDALAYLSGYSARGVNHALDQTERNRARRMSRRQAG